MRESFDLALKRVLRHEGGWADHPKDPGGATMKGVTLATFRRYYGAERTKRDLHRITDGQIAHIYRNGYWVPLACDDLPVGVDYAAFDAAVNSGPGRAAQWLQWAVGADADGQVGMATLEAVARQRPSITILAQHARRLAFLRGLRTWRTFGRGWERRCAEVRDVALDMAS